MTKGLIILMAIIGFTSIGNTEEKSTMILAPSNGTVWSSLKEKKPQKLILYGTSLTISEYVGGSGEWVVELKKLLKEKTEDRLTVINSAEGGKNSQWGLENLQERVLKHQPDYVLIEFGMNDSYTPYACTLNQVQKQLDELVLKLRESNPKIGIGFMTMNPKIEDAVKPVAPGNHNLLPAFYELYREAALKHQIDFIDNYQTWIEREKKEPGFLKLHIEDGVHPDGASAKMIAFENLKQFFNEKLK